MIGDEKEDLKGEVAQIRIGKIAEISIRELAEGSIRIKLRS